MKGHPLDTLVHPKLSRTVLYFRPPKEDDLNFYKGQITASLGPFFFELKFQSVGYKFWKLSQQILGCAL